MDMDHGPAPFPGGTRLTGDGRAVLVLSLASFSPRGPPPSSCCLTCQYSVGGHGASGTMEATYGVPCRLRALCPRVTAVGAYPGAAKWYRACLDVPRSRAPTLETVNPECPEDPMVHNDGRKLNRKVLAAER